VRRRKLALEVVLSTSACNGLLTRRSNANNKSGTGYAATRRILRKEESWADWRVINQSWIM
jgi:hypothetical protein